MKQTYTKDKFNDYLFCTIYYEILKEFDLTLNEYQVLYFIWHFVKVKETLKAHNPYAEFKNIGKFAFNIGISRENFYVQLDKLINKNLITKFDTGEYNVTENVIQSFEFWASIHKSNYNDKYKFDRIKERENILNGIVIDENESNWL